MSGRRPRVLAGELRSLAPDPTNPRMARQPLKTTEAVRPMVSASEARSAPFSAVPTHRSNDHQAKSAASEPYDHASARVRLGSATTTFAQDSRTHDRGLTPAQAPTGSASMGAALVHGAQILSQRAVWIETEEEPLLKVPTDEEGEGHASPNNHHSNGIQLDAARCGDGETGGTKQQCRPQDVNCEAVPQEAAQRRRGHVQDRKAVSIGHRFNIRTDPGLCRGEGQTNAPLRPLAEAFAREASVALHSTVGSA